MKTFDFETLPAPQAFKLMLGAIGPRPIAFVSSLNAEGQPNLAPFSFFNAMGSNPPTVVFSPARRGRDASLKDTYRNVKARPEVVINVVDHAMVQQMSLASADYPPQVNEFLKSGFTPIASEVVAPFRVKESPVQFECVVRQVIETGQGGGAGNIVICQILRAHVRPDLLTPDGAIDQRRIDLVARMGGNFYCRAHGDALFELDKPMEILGIGLDSLPRRVRLSHVLTGNDLGRLGNLDRQPSEQELHEARQSAQYQAIVESFKAQAEPMADALHRLAKELLGKDKVREALAVLMA